MATVVPYQDNREDPMTTFRETAKLMANISIERDKLKVMQKEADTEEAKMQYERRAKALDNVVKGYEYVQKQTPILLASGVKKEDIPEILYPVTSLYFKGSIGDPELRDFTLDTIRKHTEKMQPDPSEANQLWQSRFNEQNARMLGYTDNTGQGQPQPPMPANDVDGSARVAALEQTPQGGSPLLTGPGAAVANIQTPVPGAAPAAQPGMLPKQMTISAGGRSMTFEPQKTQQQMVAEAQQKAAEILSSEGMKEKLLNEGNLVRSATAMSVTADAWFDTMAFNYENLGIEPGGIINGALSTVAGVTRLNPFWEGFQGMLLEYGAAIARMAMPGTRAMFAVEQFKRTAPSDFSTLESGIYNIVTSYKDAVSKAFTSPTVVAEAIDRGELPENFRELPRAEQLTHILNVVEKDAAIYESAIWNRAYDKVPDLVPEKMAKRIVKERKLSTADYKSNPGEWRVMGGGM